MYLPMLCTQSMAEVNVDAVSEHAMPVRTGTVTTHFYFSNLEANQSEVLRYKGNGALPL